MTHATTHQQHNYDIFRPDRPGWIPEWVGDDWDRNPYAYQTKEQRMPAGRFHSLYIQMLAEMLAPVLNRLGLQLVIDVFIFYRDWEGRKQRIAPDCLIAPLVELSATRALQSYDLDLESLPLCVIEVTSPKSQTADYWRKRLLYASLGISEYLLVDIVDQQDKDHLRDQIDISLWRLAQGTPEEVLPDADGYMTLECIGVQLRANGRQIEARIAATGQPLRTSSELTSALSEAEQRAASAEQRAVAAEAELERLRTELARLRGEPDA